MSIEIETVLYTLRECVGVFYHVCVCERVREMTRWQSGGRLSQFQSVIDGVIRQTSEQRSR